MGSLQVERFKEEVTNPVFDDEEVNNIFSEDEEEKIEEQESNNKYLCPISFCTISLLGKNEMSELNHIKSNHPHVKTKMSFLML